MEILNTRLDGPRVVKPVVHGDEHAPGHQQRLGGGDDRLVAADGARADAERVNSSAVHTDFMVGGPEVEVTGTTRDGSEIPVLSRSEWAL